MSRPLPVKRKFAWHESGFEGGIPLCDYCDATPIDHQWDDSKWNRVEDDDGMYYDLCPECSAKNLTGDLDW